MNRPILLTLTLLLCAPLFAVDVDPKVDQAVRSALPICSVGAKISYDDSAFKMPQGFKAVGVRVTSDRPTCSGQFVAVTSATNGFFLGSVWPIGNDEGATTEEKLRNFAERNMREAVEVKIDRKANEDGLFPATITQTTEAGKLPLSGFVDPQGRVYFFGSFRRGDLQAQRAKAFDSYLAASPAKGKGDITVLEFSDFQCPSCRYSSGYADAVMAKFGDRVRYVRYDLPLNGHPWAFPAALAGRAIYRQKPDLFWDYKKAVYANQESLNAFTFWDWARAWAEDHDLDMSKYDADLNNAEIKSQLMTGVGHAFSNDVRATPTYMVNGVIVDAGDEGKNLIAYVEKLVGAK
ncbi:MAG TPA: thioredoxin domain-containing protein [Thermoanaerobaculia bacterium]|nr:thioredoxin domain-containing protein [Thermoanaerobaculia bacterium]